MLLNVPEYIKILYRRKWYVLLSFICLCALPMIAVYTLYDPVYKTSGQLKIIYSNSQTYFVEKMPKNIAVFEYSDKTKIDNTFFEMVQNPESLKALIHEMEITDSQGNYLKPDKFLIGSEFS